MVGTRQFVLRLGLENRSVREGAWVSHDDKMSQFNNRRGCV